MTDQIFIDSLWINTQLDFTKPQPSSWTITQKRSEQVHQLDKHDIEYFTPSHFSYSSAVFLCHNTILRNYEAFLKLYKQIPHAGTSEIEADFKFAESRVRHMPVCLGYKSERQGDDDLVLGGYVHYLVYSKLPGVKLSIEDFWPMGTFEQDAVRRAFMVAYR